MDSEKAKGKNNRPAILLQNFRNHMDTVDIPGNSIVFTNGGDSAKGDASSFRGLVFLPGHDELYSVTLMDVEAGKTWDWYQNEAGTVLVPTGVLEKMSEFCNAAYSASDSFDCRAPLVSLFRLMQLILGPDYKHDGEPIYEVLRKERNDVG